MAVPVMPIRHGYLPRVPVRQLFAGLNFYAGYPITPSSEITELLSYRLPQIGGKFIQMEDEIASIGAVVGASLAGVKAMTATSARAKKGVLWA